MTPRSPRRRRAPGRRGAWWILAGLGLLLDSAPGWAAEAGEDGEPDEVVVQAPAPDPSEAGATVLDVDAADPVVRDLADLVDRAPGVGVQRQGGFGAWAGVSIRGSSLRQVAVHLDGVPLNPDGAGAVNLSEFPLATLGQVRIWRGFAPIRYGASGMGGVVDLRTRGGRGDQPARLSLTGGSFSTARLAVSGAASGPAGPRGRLRSTVAGAASAWWTRGSFRHLDDRGTRFVLDDDRWAVRSPNDRGQAAGLVRWRLSGDRWSVGLLDAVLWRDEALPGPIGRPADEARLRTARNLGVVTASGRFGAASADGMVWHLGRGERLDDRSGEVGLVALVQQDVQHQVGAQAVVEGAVHPALALTGVVRGRWEGFTRRDLLEDAVALRRPRGVVGAGLSASWAPWDGRLRLDGMVDVRGLLQGDAPAGSWVANPRMAVRVQATRGLAVQAHAGLYDRPPDLTELYGNRGALVGNPDLARERGGQVDLGVVGRHRGAGVTVSAELTGFLTRARDLITWVQNAQRTMVAVNVGRARVLGLEAAVGLEVMERLSLATQLSLSDARNRTEDPSLQGRQLPGVPSVVLDQQLGVTPWEGIGAGYTLSWTGPTWFDGVNRARSTDRVLHGLWLQLDPWPRGPVLRLGIRNLTDRRVQVVPRDPLQPEGPSVVQPVTDFVGYPLPGRTVLLTLSWTPGAPR